MTWGDKDSHGKLICEGCGTVYLLKSQTQPVRERETLHCPKCGHLIREFNAARSYWLEPANDIAKGKSAP